MSGALCARVLLERLLPALLSAVASSKADADMRFSCLKVMSDLLALLLDLSADGDASAQPKLPSRRVLKQTLGVLGFAPCNIIIKCTRLHPLGLDHWPPFFNSSTISSIARTQRKLACLPICSNAAQSRLCSFKKSLSYRKQSRMVIILSASTTVLFLQTAVTTA